MAVILQVISPAGKIEEVVLEASRSQVEAQPGYSYRLTGNGTEAAPNVLRVGSNLIIEDLPQGHELVLADFFQACTPDEVCTAALSEFVGANNIAITPLTQPMAANTDGSFMMFTAKTETVEAEPALEDSAPLNWKPIAALGGGLLVLGAGLSGGGGGGDSEAPDAPSVTNPVTNNTRPTFTGTAEPGSNVALTIVVGGSGERVTYSSLAGADGQWTINTATQAPTSGALPAEGLPTDGSSTINAVATDTAGNVSGSTVTEVVLDVTPPAAPTLNIAGELDGPGDRLVLNRAEAADGTVLSGTAEAGSRVTVQLTDEQGTTNTEQVTAGADGTWRLNVASDALPDQDGGLGITVTATDPAGNDSVSSAASVLLDRTITDAAPTITGVIDNRAPVSATLSNGSTTNDITPTITGTVAGGVAADESVQVSRNGDIVGTATVEDGQFRFTDSVTANGQLQYETRVVDTSGNVGTASDSIVITLDTIAPAQDIVISQVRAGNDDLDDGDSTIATSFTLTLVLSDELAANESVQLIRTSGSVRGIVGSANADDAIGASSQAFEFADTAARGTSIEYEARVVDSAGQLSPISDPFNLTIIEPSP